MDPLRLVLFAGLVLHKLVWEIYKLRALPTQTPPSARSLKTWAVKSAKAIVLVGLLAQTLFLDVLPIMGAPVWLPTAGLLIYLAGLLLAIAGRIQLGKNWANIEDAAVLKQQVLVNEGIYRYIRHPIYAGDMLLLVGLELALNSWLVLLTSVPIVIFVRQALAEEKLLAQSFAGYAAYRQRTKRFIPFLI
jgi:protein-S-isoprenylcysteine O-methyltransferase Ste14